MSKLLTILNDAEVGLHVVSETGLAGPIPGLADAVLRVVLAGINAHQSITGAPLDLSTLTDFVPVADPVPTSGNISVVPSPLIPNPLVPQPPLSGGGGPTVP